MLFTHFVAWNKRSLQEVIINSLERKGSELCFLLQPWESPQPGGDRWRGFARGKPHPVWGRSLESPHYMTKMSSSSPGQETQVKDRTEQKMFMCREMSQCPSNPELNIFKTPPLEGRPLPLPLPLKLPSLVCPPPCPPPRAPMSFSFWKLACWRKVNLALLLSIDYLSWGWGL